MHVQRTVSGATLEPRGFMSLHALAQWHMPAKEQCVVTPAETVSGVSKLIAYLCCVVYIKGHISNTA